MKLAITLMLILSLDPVYKASSNQEQLDSLTKEQQKLQADIADKAEEITNAQIEIDTLNSTIESNQTQIDNLNTEVSEKQVDLDNQMDSFKSTLELMQKLDNSNALLAYVSSSTDEDNFLLKINNVAELSNAIQTNIQAVTKDLKAINKALESAESYKAQNIDNKSKAQALLDAQESTEAELREQLNGVDSDVLAVSTQISLEEAAKLEEEQQAETAAAAKKAEEKANKKANNTSKEEETTSTDPVEPEKPEVAEPEEPEEPEVEPEEPEVVEPEEPEVVEPEEPDTSGNGYPADGNVSGYKSQLLAAAGISSSDMTYVDYIISRESGWNYLISNAYSGAYGLCQALPGSKMASSGSDWATNPETQMRWCNSYAVSRYGSWQGAYEFWLENSWW